MGLQGEQIDKVLFGWEIHYNLVNVQIAELSKSHQYDKACARYFEYSHQMPEGGLGAVITHPNEYFDISRKILSGERERDRGIATQEVIFDGGAADPMPIKQEEVEDDFDEDIEF